MQRLSYPSEIVLSNNITRNRIVPSFKDSPRKPLRRRPENEEKVPRDPDIVALLPPRNKAARKVMHDPKEKGRLRKGQRGGRPGQGINALHGRELL